jgi:hypothetical protein
MKNNKILHCQNSSNRKTTKYHTVRIVPTSMKNNKIPHCQNSSNKKTTKYHTVRTVPTSMKNNIEKQQNATLSEQFQ